MAAFSNRGRHVTWEDVRDPSAASHHSTMTTSTDFAAFTAATSLYATPSLGPVMDPLMKKRADDYYSGENLTKRMTGLRGALYNDQRGIHHSSPLYTAEYAELGFAQVAKLLERLNARVEALEAENTALKERVTALETPVKPTGPATPALAALRK